MQYANKGLFTFRTLAGLIEYPGITAEKTVANALLSTHSWLTALLLYASLALSAAATTIFALNYGGEPAWRIKHTSLFRKTPLGAQALTSIILVAVLLYTGASVFAYHPSELSLVPTPPPITFHEPLYDYTCTLTRTGRVAITYTDFETYPVLGWNSNGGIWSSVSGVPGAKGNVLQGSDDNGGVGGASQYYYESLSNYLSLWIVVKTRLVNGMGYYGASMIREQQNRMYTAEIHNDTVKIQSYKVEDPKGWWTLSSSSIPGYSIAAFYIIVVNYMVTEEAVTIMARVYDSTGNLLATVSASSTSERRFKPAYIGVEVNNVSAYFDDFLIATSDPMNVSFSGLYAGMGVEVWDNLGNLVAYGMATEDILRLSVVHDVVVGTGVDGRIVVKYPDGSPSILYRVPQTDAILGGDAYQLTSYPISIVLGANKTSAEISAVVSANPSAITTAAFIGAVNWDTKPYYARLVLSPQSILDQLTANISLISGSSATATNITIVNGAVISDATSWITIGPSTATSAVTSAYFPSIGRSATLYMLLEYSTLPGGQGACAYYPIELNLNAASISASTSTANFIESELYMTENVLEANDVVEVP
ncbi:MAG: hypothetical protein QXH24_04600 [Candidatus Bathyarchaeia archaeon]